MKKLIAISTVALTLASVSAFAQGTIAFANSSTSRITVGNSTAAAALGMTSSGGAADYVPAGNTTLRVGLYFSATENGTYTQAGSAATFSAVSGGRFSGGNIAIPGVPGGSSAWFQVRVWEQSYGADYAAAETAAAANGRFSILGISNSQNLSTGALTPTPLSTGLQSFAVTAAPVPEPSTIALGFLGLAGLFIFRRRQ
jgi:hypothetical protein